MKLYEVTTINLRTNGEFGDEFQTYLGFDFEEAKTAKELALAGFNALTAYDRAHSTVEARVYNIADDTDVTDPDAIIEAVCECGGYDLF